MTFDFGSRGDHAPTGAGRTGYRRRGGVCDVGWFESSSSACFRETRKG